MAVLFFDTATPALSVGVLSGRRMVTAQTLPGTGHAELVASSVRSLLEKAGVPLGDIRRLIVSVGPGSFIGVRVGIGFAGGIAAGTGAETVPVTTLFALACSLPREATGTVLMDARRGQVYLQHFAAGQPASAPDLLDHTSARDAAEAHGGLRTGSAVPLLWPGEVSFGPIAPDPSAVLRRAHAWKAGPLSAVYVRAPDAKPPRPPS